MRLSGFVFAAAVAAFTAGPAFPQFHASGNCDGQNAYPGRPLEVVLQGGRFQPVTGAPYSARESSVEVRTLPDGTHITSPSLRETATWRDSVGRVRTEIHVTPGPLRSCESQFVEIQDPVAGYTYLLDLKNEVVHRAPIVAVPARAAAEVAGDGPHMPRQNPPATEPLGSQTMMGVKVVGLRTTRNVPARPGGAAATTEIAETWMAPQLALILYEKMSNPAQGTESTRTLKDLSTAEPDPNLFQPPAAFRVVDETADRNGRFTVTVGGTAPVRAVPQPADGTVCAYSVSFPAVPLPVRPVTGAPYSARVTITRTGTLADGSQETRGGGPRDEKTWRDSLGRERWEETAGLRVGNYPCNTYVSRMMDPVAGYFYELDSVNRIAHRMALKVMPAVNGPDTRMPARRADPNTTSESLGTKSISGVMVVGTKETTVTPAGSMGNDRSLTSTREAWYSPRLALEVYSRSSSQNATSTSIRSLEDLSTVEPDPALFQVPAGYKIVDETAAFSITISRPQVEGPAR